MSCSKGNNSIMNVLFIDNDADPPYFGGTTTLTRIQADILEEEGYGCFLGYLNDFDHPSVLFEHKIKISRNNVQELIYFVKEYNIKYVINQMQDFDYGILDPLKELGLIFIHAFYTRPQSWLKGKNELAKDFFNDRSFISKCKVLLKLFLYPIYTYYYNKRKIPLYFQNTYDYCDYYILLADGYVDRLIHYVPYANREKIFVLGNPITYNDFIGEDEIHNKRKNVLMVCRLSFEKRVDEALKIWQEIEKDERLSDWHLQIIGDGIESENLSKLKSKLMLKRVSFLGAKNKPISFYKEASIFMMTSKLEGWPMVLMECQQYGDVPIIYDSFEASRDIIIDGWNGFVVEDNNRVSYINKLKHIMLNEEDRDRMVNNSLVFSRSHTKDAYKNEFMKIIQETVKNEKEYSNRC